MQKLIDAGLYGHEIVTIDDPKIVGRYNRCLESCGIEPTNLNSFHIDGIGWSPEVAQEKNDRLYLMNGTPNQVAIIVTPNQRHKPVYCPVNSFDRSLMDAFFQNFTDEAADITTETGICLDLEKDFSHFESAADLFLVDAVTVRPFTAMNTIVAAQEQQALVKKFMEEDTSWRDEKLVEKIIESANAHGDLRSRKMFIPSWQFKNLKHFHTLAFGGVFVFRPKPKRRKDAGILIFEQKEESIKLRQEGVFHVNDHALLEELEKARLIEFNPGTNIPFLTERIEYLCAQAICTSYPDVEYEKLSPSKKKKFLAGIKHDLPPTLFELERIVKKINRGVNIAEIIADITVTDELKTMLMRPHSNLPAEYRNVIWQTLLRIDSHDVVRLYAEDKNLFYALYGTWTEAKKNWAIGQILEKHMKIIERS